ncbi:unnamed protein product [Penicillium glandicola]
MAIKAFILVFRGDPLDYTKFRHAALHFEFPNGTTCAMHVEGAPGIFEFVPLDNYYPEKSRSLVKKIPVVELPDWVDEVSFKGLISRTPVNNGELDWNCQNWVGDALARMRALAIGLMIDVCLEAQDE